MSSFKDFLNQDLQTFFNMDEFAEMHVIDGEEVLAIVDSDQLQDHSNPLTNGIYRSNLTVYVKSEEFEKPAIGSRLSLDSEYYYVETAFEEDGVLTIRMTANEA